MKLQVVNVRTRLTLWYAFTLGLVLVIYSTGIYGFLKQNLLGNMDRLLREDIESVVESLQDLPLESGKLVYDRYQDRPSHDFRERWLLEVWNLGGTRLFALPKSEVSPLGIPDPTRCRRRGIDAETLVIPSGLRLRIKCETVQLGNENIIVRTVRSADRVLDDLSSLFFLMALGIHFGIGLSVMGGYLLARRTLFPIQRMTEQARSITAERLSDRLQIGNPNDELGKLALTFNETFSRLERSFDQMKRFTADASHELRTPLTAIRTMGEVALRDHLLETSQPQAEAISSILEETDRLRHLVESLLTLSRADSGQLKVNQKTEKIADLVKEVVQHLDVLAEEKDQTFQLNLDEDCSAICDRGILRQAIVNLVDNAIKYSPEKTQINLVLKQERDSIVLEVNDTGPGIGYEHQSKVFDRFYRVDPARTREQGGTGLGLSIAKWAAEVNGGQLELESTPGKGSTFRIILALQSPNA